MVLDATKNKRTDPEGSLEQQSATQARLTDFDIDGAEVGVDGTRLKPKHIAFLRTLIEMIKSAPGQRFTIAIGGFADTLNTSGKFDNQELSRRRAAAVERFLRSELPRGVPVTFDLKAFGPSGALPPNTPDSFSRAVDVALTAPGDPAPQRPRGPSPGGPAGPRSFPRAQGRGGFVFGCVREFEIGRSQNFKIRIIDLEIVTVSIGVKTARIFFQIVDEDLNLGAEYHFFGADGIFLERVEATFIRKNTNFRRFRTLAPTRLTDFQSATLQTGFGASLANPLGPLPSPIVSLTFKDKDGVAGQVRSSIDMDNQEGDKSRFIKGTLTLESKCRGARGALEVNRTNDFL